MGDWQALADALYGGKRDDVVKHVQDAVDNNESPEEILNALIAGMDRLGEDFKNNKVYVPEVLIAARAMSAGMEILRPKLAEAGVESKGTVVIGTVKGDLHDIGKNLVCMMFEGAGFNVVDLEVNVTPEKFIEAAQENNAVLIGMSALLTTTMVNMKHVVEAVQSSDLAGKVKTLIGGAPVTQQFADEIGADGYAPDAASAVGKAKELLGTA